MSMRVAARRRYYRTARSCMLGGAATTFPARSLLTHYYTYNYSNIPLGTPPDGLYRGVKRAKLGSHTPGHIHLEQGNYSAS